MKKTNKKKNGDILVVAWGGKMESTYAHPFHKAPKDRTNLSRSYQGGKLKFKFMLKRQIFGSMGFVFGFLGPTIACIFTSKGR